MKERVIVTLTSYSKRIGNIPTVIDTIFKQTKKPDLIVLNLAHDEIIPENIQHYIDLHSIETNRVSDTKVYKKLIPTLKKYPNDCIISIDDDWIYPKGMIEDFLNVHKLYPNNPISGNRVIMFDMQCHCGCASLTKAEYFGKYLDLIDDELIENCSSDDIVYTYFANKAGIPYLRTKDLYFTNMIPYNDCDSYSDAVVFSNTNGIKSSYDYLVNRFGSIDNFCTLYIKDKNISSIMYDIHKKGLETISFDSREQGKYDIYSTKSYKIGNAILKPFDFLNKM